MHIDGLKELFSRFITRPEQVTKNAQAINTIAAKPPADNVDISEPGKKLSYLQPEKTGKVDIREKINGDKYFLLMDSSLSRMEKTLDEMRFLAMSAADSSLNTVDRLQMQIRMEELRDKLEGASNEMSFQLAEMSGYKVRELGASPSSDKSLLERALARALNGEAWDVAERYEEIKPAIDPEQEGEADIEPVTGRWVVVTDDEEMPTTRQLLEGSGTIVLMDERSALQGVERIDKEIKAARAMRKEFEEFVENEPTPSQGNSKMSESELAVIQKLIKEEQTRAEALRALLNTKEGDSPREKAYSAMLSAKKPEGAEEENHKFHTELGVMEYNSDGYLRLTRPANPKGEMFVKIEKMFEKIAKNL